MAKVYKITIETEDDLDTKPATFRVKTPDTRFMSTGGDEGRQIGKEIWGLIALAVFLTAACVSAAIIKVHNPNWGCY